MSSPHAKREDLAHHLDGMDSIEGLKICRSLEEQKRTPLPHVMVYPDGEVRVFVRQFTSRVWDPMRPVRKQLS